MKISRRKFITAAPLAAGAILQLQGVALGQGRDSAADAPDVLASLDWNSFYQYIYTDFVFGRGGNAVPLRLVEMVNTAPSGHRVRRGQECFVMKFQGPYQQPLRQGTYTVNHFALGDFNLFITDGGRVSRNKYYIAVINRIVG